MRFGRARRIYQPQMNAEEELRSYLRSSAAMTICEILQRKEA